MSGVETAVNAAGLGIQGYNSLQAVQGDQDALAREVGKMTNSGLQAAMKSGARSIPVIGYFTSAGIDFLDPKLASGLGNFILRTNIDKAMGRGYIDELQATELRNLLAREPGKVNPRLLQMMIESGAYK
ncbi:MAG: hypothetical protein LBV45_03150 [Xanthomonadaceae bacterium]|jgi:hypothetical protein|nr:hypothetical protein [Xanthomonadaceae bacterium]